MSVNVDSIRPNSSGPLRESCHLLADSDLELEEFACRLRIAKSAKHGDYYDLSSARRVWAVRMGAVEVGSRDLVAVRRIGRRGEQAR
jgi:hypothetical protein